MSHAKYYNGKTIKEWSAVCGIEVKTIKSRLKDGWSIDDAISVPHGGKRVPKISLSKIAAENKMSFSTLKNRINKGMTVEEAVKYDPRKDMIGYRSGRLVVEKEIEPKRDPSGKPRRQFLCLCDCGNETTALAEALISGNKQSCGCLRKEITSKRQEKNLIGQKFGRWTIESEAYRDKIGIHWNAICDCGNRGTPTTGNLLSGVSTSCGCYNREQISLRERIDLTNQKFFMLTAIECVGTNEYNNCLWRCKCDCGNEIVTTAGRLLGEQILSCGCLRSKYERMIEDMLILKDIFFKKEKYFKDLKHINYLFFDFCIIDHDNKIHLIEYQGKQHYVDCGEFGRLEREITDRMKKDYCSKNNIPLYEIRYDSNVEDELNKIIAHVNPVLNSELSEKV